VNAPALVNTSCRQVEALLETGQTEEALNLLDEIILSDPANRELQLYALLLKIKASGPEPFELDIDRIRLLDDLTDAERQIIAAIFLRGCEAALGCGDEGKAAAYRRSLRRFAAGLPLERPILPNTFSTPQVPIDPAEPLSHKETVLIRQIFAPAETPSLQRKQKRWHTKLLGAANSINWPVYQGRACSTVERVSVLVTPLCQQSKKLLSRRVPAHYTIVGVLIGSLMWLPYLMRKDAVQVRDGMKPGAPGSPVAQQVTETSEQTASRVVSPAVALAAKPPTVPQLESPSDVEVYVPRLSRQQRRERRSAEATEISPEEIERRPSVPIMVTNPRVMRARQIIGLRSEPRYSSPKELTLRPGAKLVVIDRDGSWLRVQSEDGSTGYVRQEFLSPTG